MAPAQGGHAQIEKVEEDRRTDTEIRTFTIRLAWRQHYLRLEQPQTTTPTTLEPHIQTGRQAEYNTEIRTPTIRLTWPLCKVDIPKSRKTNRQTGRQNTIRKYGHLQYYSGNMDAARIPNAEA